MQHRGVWRKNPDQQRRPQRVPERTHRPTARSPQRPRDGGTRPRLRTPDPGTWQLRRHRGGGYGYGYSDMSARERSNENISKELHEVLTKVNIKRPYVLGRTLDRRLLHAGLREPLPEGSVGGDRIDATIPKAESGPVELPLQDAVGNGSPLSRGWSAWSVEWPPALSTPTATPTRQTNWSGCV